MRPLSLLSLVRLFARGVRAAPWTRLSTRAKVGGLTITSITTNELPRLALVGDIVFLTLVAYTTYLLANPVLKKLFADLADDTGLRVILALPAVGLVHGITWSTNTGVATSFHEASIAFALLGTPLLVDGYLSRTDTPQTYPFAYGLRLQGFFGVSQEKISVSLQRMETVDENTVLPYKAIVSYEARTLMAIVLSSPFYVWGGLLVVFEGFYPALELALLVGAAFGPSIARRSPRFDDENELLTAIDTEEQSTRAFMTKNAFHPKWLTSAGFIALNILLAVGLFTAGFGGLSYILAYAETFTQQPSTDAFLGVAAFVAFTSTSFVFGLYALWFWRVELARLPAFLAYWRGAYDQADTESPTNEMESPAKARPPWGLLPPAALLLLTSLVIAVGERVQSNPTSVRLVFGVYVVCWMLGLLFIGWAIVQWHRRDPQPVRNESRVIVGNCLVKMMAIASLIVAVNGLDDPFLEFLALMTGILILFFYFLDIMEVLESKRGESSILAWSPALGVIALFFIVIRHPLTGRPMWLTTLLNSVIGVLVVTIILQKAQRWFANKHAPREDFLPEDTASTEPDDPTTSE